MHDAIFYIYFPKDHKGSATKLEETLKSRGFQTDLHWLDYDEGQWSLEFRRQYENIEEVHEIEPYLQALAESHGGEYDGSEISV